MLDSQTDSLDILIISKEPRSLSVCNLKGIEYDIQEVQASQDTNRNLKLHAMEAEILLPEHHVVRRGPKPIDSV